MLSETMRAALNKQINEEFYSAYLYLAMSADFAHKGLNGLANWFRVQALEEQVHASKIYDYVLERGGKVQLQPIAGPADAWDGPLAAFEGALAHERHITGCINDLASQAIEEKDHASGIFLQWFVTEQVEEEATAQEIVGKLQLIGDHPHGVFMLDKELAARAFVPPPANDKA